MAKNQGTRHRKHDSRNGSTGRGKAGEAAMKLMRNGKGAGRHHKQLEESPAWKRMCGALVLITILAAAFMTGVIRIDHNVDTVEEDVPCTYTSNPQPIVAEIQDPGNRTRRNATEYVKEEAGVAQNNVASLVQESSYGEEDSTGEVTVSDKNQDGTRVKENEDRRAESKESQRNSEIPAKPNVTKQGVKKHSIPVEEETKEDNGNVKQASNNITSEEGEELRKAFPNDQLLPNEKPSLDEEKDMPTDSSEPLQKNYSKHKNLTLPKGKLVRPKKKKGKKIEPLNNKAHPDHPKYQEKIMQEEIHGRQMVPSWQDDAVSQATAEIERSPTQYKGGSGKPKSDEVKERAAEAETKLLSNTDNIFVIPQSKMSTFGKEEDVQKQTEKSTSKENVSDSKYVQLKVTKQKSNLNQDSTSSVGPAKTNDGKEETPPKSKQMEIKENSKTMAKCKEESVTTHIYSPPGTSSKTEAKSPLPPPHNRESEDSLRTSSHESDDVPQTPAQESKSIDHTKTKVKTRSEDIISPHLSPSSSSSSKTKTVSKETDADTKDCVSREKSKDVPKAQTQTETQTKIKTDKNRASSPHLPSDTKSIPKQAAAAKATHGRKDGRDGVEAAAKKTAVPSSRAYIDPVDRGLEVHLQEAEKLLKKKRTEQAMGKLEEILEAHPDSPRARYGMARTLDQLAEERRSNELLQNAIDWYHSAADAPDTPVEIRKGALSRVADRLSFLGKGKKSIEVYQNLVKDFPREVEFQKSLAVQHLIIGQNDQAKPYFRMILRENPNDGFALVHLGFILKIEDSYKEAIPLLRRGIDSGERGTNEGKFFFHLGDSYLREGLVDEAYKVYDEGVSRGHFRSRYQRSLYNVDTLRAKAFWTPKDAGYVQAAKRLESNWEAIRDEAIALLSETGYFLNEEEKLRETGDWKQFTLYAQGKKNEANCQRTPITCRLIDTIPESRGCKRGQVKFSVMHPGTHVWPHCGPTNCRLRAHLGLIVPQPVRLRVANRTRTWEEGKLFIFDDSFEHEVWQEADSLRLVLIADLWHPDLSENQKKRLSPI